ncbi:MAG: hypothetical protein H6772_00085 [Pseudomonadales bacterium]|nr:hypothetical protein [Pseudomonadales bacterium]
MSKSIEANSYYSMGKERNNRGKKTKRKTQSEVEIAKEQGKIIRHERGKTVIKNH